MGLGCLQYVCKQSEAPFMKQLSSLKTVRCMCTDFALGALFRHGSTSGPASPTLPRLRCYFVECYRVRQCDAPALWLFLGLVGWFEGFLLKINLAICESFEVPHKFYNNICLYGGTAVTGTLQFP